MIVGASILLAKTAAEMPYCESCEDWTESQEGRLKGLSRQDVQPLLDRGDLAGLLALAEPDYPSSHGYIRLQRQHCQHCTDTAYLTVSEVSVELKKDKEQERSEQLLENATLNRKLSTQFTDRFVQPVRGRVGIAAST